MKTNLKGIIVNINSNGEFIPYLNFRMIDKFITYLNKNGMINRDYSYQDLMDFLKEYEEEK